MFYCDILNNSQLTAFLNVKLHTLQHLHYGDIFIINPKQFIGTLEVSVLDTHGIEATYTCTEPSAKKCGRIKHCINLHHIFSKVDFENAL